MTGWTESSLGDLCTMSSGKRRTSQSDGSYPLFGSNGIIGRSGEKLADAGIIVGRVGAYCGSLRLSRSPFWATDNTIVIKPTIAIDLGYLYAALTAVELHALAGGAAQPLINQSRLKALRITVPSFAVQLRISALLSAFDELIEINERRIELLEDLARSLYREWFVHFRFPGYEGIRFVDSASGKIPEDWCLRRIDDVTSSITRGIAPKYADDGHWTVLNQRCIRGQRITFTLTRRHEGSVSDVKQLRFGDVLINSTGVGTLGRVGMLLEETGRATVDSHVTIVRPASPDLHPWLGLHLLGRESAFQVMGTGSTGQTELGRAAVGELPILVPPPAVLKAFGDAAWPLLRPMPTLLRYRDSFAEVRDFLLSRLVTGQLDISDVDLDILTATEAE